MYRFIDVAEISHENEATEHSPPPPPPHPDRPATPLGRVLHIFGFDDVDDDNATNTKPTEDDDAINHGMCIEKLLPDIMYVVCVLRWCEYT